MSKLKPFLYHLRGSCLHTWAQVKWKLCTRRCDIGPLMLNTGQLRYYTNKKPYRTCWNRYLFSWRKNMKWQYECAKYGTGVSSVNNISTSLLTLTLNHPRDPYKTRKPHDFIRTSHAIINHTIPLKLMFNVICRSDLTPLTGVKRVRYTPSPRARLTLLSTSG